MSAGRKLGREQNGRERGGAWKAGPAPSLYILPAAFPQKGNFTYQLASNPFLSIGTSVSFLHSISHCQQLYITTIIDHHITSDNNLPPYLG